MAAQDPPSDSPLQTTRKPPSASSRLTDYNEKISGITQLEREIIIPALAMRAFHLPGNAWCDDWIQYFSNNHPVFGICCHHRLHPVRFGMRVVILIGSVVFGLAVTNVIWLLNHAGDETLAVVSVGTVNGDPQEIHITKGMVILWTVGGGLHALFDNTIWFMAACVCCLPGQVLGQFERYRRFGAYFVIMAVVLSTAAATFVVILRVALDSSDSSVSLTDTASAGLVDDVIDLSPAKNLSSYRFLISYAIELALAFFAYNPVIGTLLFSGILGCGKVPILGGRPYEVMREQLIEQRGRRTPSSFVSRSFPSVAENPV